MTLAREANSYYADPALVQFDDHYFIYPTTDGRDGWASDSFRVLESHDLQRWIDAGEILRLGRDVAWADSFAWAPAAVQGPDGRIYFYFTADDNIGVAVSDHPTGPFRDLGRPLITRGAYPGRAIDPAVFVDDDGTAYLLWGNSVLHVARLGPTMTSIDPDSVQSWTDPSFREAGHIHRRGDTYYLTWSENDTREPEYRVRWAKGVSPFGPWTVHGVLLGGEPELGIRGTGHHSIMRLPRTDDWVIAYHRFHVPSGDGFHRELVIQPLIHLPDGDLSAVTPQLDPLNIYNPHAGRRETLDANQKEE